jgi:16S rRNA processing protein RimM
LGKLVAGHGVRGLGRVKPFHTGSPVLTSASHLWLRHADGRCERFAVVERRQHKQMFLVRFAGIETLDALEPWIGSVVEVERSTLPATSPEEIYAFEAVGLAVATRAGEPLGEVVETLALPANDVWVVARPDGRELLIPVIPEVVREIDLSARSATIEPLPGLLED